MILLIIVIALCALSVHHYHKKFIREKNKISFRESIDLADLPIVTFYNNNEKFNFILDTGSTDSHISSSSSTRLTGEPHKYAMNIAGYGASKEVSGTALRTFLKYKEKDYEAMLHISPHLDAAFETIKVDHGIQLHGLLGNDFLQKHRYVLDFAELIAYNK